MILVPAEMIMAVAEVFTEGAARYSPWNWLEHPADWSVYISAHDRHMNAWKLRQDHDPQTGMWELAHAIANLSILLVLQIRRLGKDDRQPSTRPADRD